MLASIFLSGCATNRIVIEESWTQKPAKVKVVFTEAFYADPGDLADILPRDVENFSQWYKAQLETELEKYSNGVTYTVENVSRDDITSETSSVNGSNIKTPKLKTMDDAADVYLVMDDLWLGKIEEMKTIYTTAAGTTYMQSPNPAMNALSFGGLGQSSEKEKNFVGKGSFAYFDAKTGAKLGYGEFESKANYKYFVSRNNWTDVVKKTVDTMFENTPIAK